MYDFILQAVFFGSLAVMAFLFARALPRVEEATDPKGIYDHIDEWLGKLPLQHLDERANSFMFKFLKRTRVIVMKLDNRIIRHLDRVRKSGEQAVSPTQELLDHVQGENKDQLF